MKKSVYIKLKYAKRLAPTGHGMTYQEYYVISQLQNAASVYVGAKCFRMDGELTQSEADALCETSHYEVTINK